MGLPVCGLVSAACVTVSVAGFTKVLAPLCGSVVTDAAAYARAGGPGPCHASFQTVQLWWQCGAVRTVWTVLGGLLVLHHHGACVKAYNGELWSATGRQ